jgi:Holliday junction resolvase RusA-like endonuclease
MPRPRRWTGKYLDVPNRRKRDVDNFAKCIFDGLTRAGAIEDDKLVDDFHGHRRYDPANPRTVIVVKSSQEQMFERN